MCRDAAVTHPAHYTDIVPGIECIDVVRHFNFCVGGAIKYLWRHEAKGNPIQDLRKAIQLIEFEIQRRENGSVRGTSERRDRSRADDEAFWKILQGESSEGDENPANLDVPTQGTGTNGVSHRGPVQ